MLHNYRIVISGQVQNVCFRAKTKSHANRLRLKGTVRNLINGTVEICLSGTKDKVDQLMQAMKKESPPIQITSIKIMEFSFDPIYFDFRIID